MSEEIKMSDYFKNTNKAVAIRAIYYSCKEDNQPQSNEVSERKHKTLEAAAFAVENHDRLTEENKRLREALVALVETSDSNEHQLSQELLEFHCDSKALTKAKQLLSELTEKQNDK